MLRPALTLAAVALSAVVSARAALADPPVVPVPPPNPPATVTPPSGPAPHIKFDATNVNLGDVVRGEDAVATFTYHNTGEVPLHILSAKPG
jgi:hypothetical protein